MDSTRLQIEDNPEKFLIKLMDAYPEDYVTLKKIIGLGKIVYSSAPSMTAAVVNTKPYTLIFGKPFLEENIKTIEDCVYILSHELTHLLLGHFARDILELFKEKKLRQYATHIIVDCQVNATCYHSLKEEKYLEFIKRFYSKTEMPACFFRPDGEPPTPELATLHQKLYSPDGITNEELIEGLMPWFKENEDQLKDFIKQLLGNHSDILNDEKTTDSSGEDKEEGDVPSLVQSYAKDLKDMLEEEEVAEKPQKPSTTAEQDPTNLVKKGCSPTGREAIKHQIDMTIKNINYNNSLLKKLNKSYVSSPSSRLTAAIDDFFPKTPTRTPIPNFYDRRTVALHFVGEHPIFHTNKDRGTTQIVPCYMDVSGSQSHVIKDVILAVVRRKEQIGHKVFCFSTEIHETKIDELKRGKYKSTGGTDFNPVFQHMIKNKYKKAIILTDGEAFLDKILEEEVKSKHFNIKVGWTVPQPNRNILGFLAKEEFFLFDRDKQNDK